MFDNRRQAGRLLAQELANYKQNMPVVLALARGGVPVAFEIAKKLQRPFDVLIVRKLGMLNDPEFGIGAIAEGKSIYLDKKLLDRLPVSRVELQELIDKEQIEIIRRKKLYRGDKRLPVLKNKTVILVDDGLATGVTMKTAVIAVQKKCPRSIIIAVPVCSSDTAKAFIDKNISVICLRKVSDMRAIGEYYRDFSQVSDEEVINLLQNNNKTIKQYNNKAIEQLNNRAMEQW
jgi:putative phosphoribosyl transferase